MPDYKKMYLQLFSAITNALEAIASENYGIAKEILISAQQQSEEIYIESYENK